MKFFTENEFACQCCGVARMDREFLAALDALRAALGAPILITSGYRCPDHNDAVSSTGRAGPHTTGKAADLYVARHRWRDLAELAYINFNGVGVNVPKFIHVDSLGRRTWSY